MPARPKVFVSRAIPEVGLNRIRDHCDTDVWPEPLPPSYSILRAKVADCDGLVSLLTDRIDADLLAAAPRLKVVSNYAVGFNNIDVAAANSRGIAVGNTPGVLTDATADMAMCLLLAASRRLVEGHRYAADGKWRTWEPLGLLGQDLVERTVGIIGMGRIGFAFARRCRNGWGMRVLYHDVRPSELADRELGVRCVDVDTLLAESDFVSLHTDLNEKTYHLIGAAQLAKMKPTAVLINTARGPLVDSRALADALGSGTIFAAGLDVTDPEPLPPTDPLFQVPNAIVAPHIASATVGTRNAMAEICADNLLAGLAGRPLRAWVNPEVARGRRSE